MAALSRHDFIAVEKEIDRLALDLLGIGQHPVDSNELGQRIGSHVFSRRHGLLGPDLKCVRRSGSHGGEEKREKKTKDHKRQVGARLAGKESLRMASWVVTLPAAKVRNSAMVSTYNIPAVFVAASTVPTPSLDSQGDSQNISDRDLAKVVTLWPSPTPAIKAAINALVKHYH